MNSPEELFKSFDRFVSSLLIDSKRKRNEKIVYYLRLYTKIHSSYVNFCRRCYKTSLRNLRESIVLSKGFEGKREEPYIKRIVKIINDLLKDVEKLKRKRKFKQHKYIVKAKFHTAMGLCILRILSS